MYKLSLLLLPGGPGRISILPNVQVRRQQTEGQEPGWPEGRGHSGALSDGLCATLGQPRAFQSWSFLLYAAGRAPGPPGHPSRQLARLPRLAQGHPRPSHDGPPREGPGVRARTPAPPPPPRGFGVGAGAGRSRGAARADAGPRDAAGTGRGGRRRRRAFSFCASAGGSASRRQTHPSSPQRTRGEGTLHSSHISVVGSGICTAGKLRGEKDSHSLLVCP
ncbi:protein SOGA3-like [Camelus ferus]|uniref:Protein SOGA3-like n=1 Tax=Camelus ferus TaxID=419612 RepID=A0A8B8S314_CAMFR|nr:protein SOGA3-like [Camelus ferus]